MIEWIDAIIATLVAGKIGGDEFFRRRNAANGNGRNGNASIGRRLTTLDKKVDAVGVEIRKEIQTAREWASGQHGELHEKINECGKDIARVEGRLGR